MFGSGQPLLLRVKKASHVLATWNPAFVSLEVLVSDQGFHFKNMLMSDMTANLKLNQRFTVSYSRWASGTVEKICREVLRPWKSILNEFFLGQRDWPAIVEFIASVRNQSLLKRLGLCDDNVPGIYRTPLVVFHFPRTITPTSEILAYSKLRPQVWNHRAPITESDNYLGNSISHVHYSHGYVKKHFNPLTEV